MKKSNIILALASAMLLASCDNTPKPEGAAITKEEAAKRVSDASDKYEDGKLETKKGYNLTYTYTETETDDGKTTTEKKEIKASLDEERSQFYFHFLEDGKANKVWAYKDGEKYFVASEGGDNKNKNEVAEIMFQASFKTSYLAIGALFSASYDGASNNLARAIRETSLSVEGVKKNDIVTTSKGEGHVYFSWNFESSVKDEEKTSTTKIEYYYVMDNYRPTRELYRAEIKKGDDVDKVEYDFSIDWNKAAYPGNPNF